MEAALATFAAWAATAPSPQKLKNINLSALEKTTLEAFNKANGVNQRKHEAKSFKTSFAIQIEVD